MGLVFYGFEKLNIMDIKLKYKAWIGEKHADIAHKLMGNDIETFALEFAEHLVKNYSIPDVVERSEQLVCPDCKSEARMHNGFIWCENDDCGGIYREK